MHKNIAGEEKCLYAKHKRETQNEHNERVQIFFLKFTD